MVAAEQRMKAQNNKKYYDEKLKTEKAKVATAQESAKVLEQEFEVSPIYCFKVIK